MPIFKVLLILIIFSMQACIPPKLVVKGHVKKGEIWEVVVFPFQDAPGAEGSGRYITDLFSVELLKLPQYNIIEKGLVESKIPKTVDAGKALDAEMALSIGEELGADAILLGTVNTYQERRKWFFPPAKVSVTVRLVDVKTGHLVWTVHHLRDYGLAHTITTLFPFPPTMILSGLYSPTAQKRATQAVNDIVTSLDKSFRELEGKQ